MKKRILSAALLLLLVLCWSPCAYADVSYPDPEPIEIGSMLDHLAATVAPGSTVTATAGTLPEGIALETEETEDGLNVYLRGVPSAAGVYYCIININGTGTMHTIQVNPALPAVSAGPDIQCYPNDSALLSVSAATGVEGSLSYQWYSSQSGANSGGVAISGATEASYQANTAYVGTAYYYCRVTNSSGGLSVYTDSPVITVTVEELSVDSIALETLPAKTRYTVGDTLDAQGLQIRALFSNGSTRLLSGGFGVYPTRLDKAGEQSVEVSYQGHTCTFTVQVEQAEEVIEGIGVLTLPAKTEYEVGDSLETRGLSIRVYTNNGHRDVSEGLVCTPETLDKAGTQTVTVRYEGKSCTFTVTVEEAEKPLTLTVKTLPDQINYTVGDTLDTKGLVLKLVTSRGNVEEISSGFTCDPTRLDTAGRQTVTVRYEDSSCTFNVNVREAAASPSPAPSAEPSPETTPAPTPHVSSHSAHRTELGKTLVAIIIVAALAALAVLGLYVFILNRGGFDAAWEAVKALFQRKK